jgi:DNA-binding IclR family transcriptional regulator
MTLTQMANHTGFYKSTILRLTVSLERFGYLVRGDSGRFRLGPTAWRIGAAYRQRLNLADILRPELKVLSDITSETASFYIKEGDSRVCLYRCEPSRSIRHSIDEGAKMPLDQGASGRVLQAYSDPMPDASLGIIKDGYALSLGERDAEVAAMSVPLLSKSGRLVGALSVSGLITRFSESSHSEMLAALQKSQQSLMAQIST